MNIKIGTFQTKNFDIAPLAVEGFMVSIGSLQDEHLDALQAAAVELDAALGIEKEALTNGTASENEYESFLEHIDKAESILDDLGILKIHSYMRDYNELTMAELVNLDSDEIADLDDEMEGDDYDDSDEIDDEFLEDDLPEPEYETEFEEYE